MSDLLQCFVCNLTHHLFGYLADQVLSKIFLLQLNTLDEVGLVNNYKGLLINHLI